MLKFDKCRITEVVCNNVLHHRWIQIHCVFVIFFVFFIVFFPILLLLLFFLCFFYVMRPFSRLWLTKTSSWKESFLLLLRLLTHFYHAFTQAPQYIPVPHYGFKEVHLSFPDFQYVLFMLISSFICVLYRQWLQE